jgi:hypothetical protein
LPESISTRRSRSNGIRMIGMCALAARSAPLGLVDVAGARVGDHLVDDGDRLLASAGGGLGEEVVERVLHDRSGQVPLLGRDDQLLLLTSLGRPVSLP